MDQRHHPNYLAIWVWLALLMCVSVAASHLPISAVIVLGVILGLSLIKAMLVALYYMHLRFEPRLLLILIAGPLVLAAVLITALLPDSAHARREAPAAAANATSTSDTSSHH